MTQGATRLPEKEKAPTDVTPADSSKEAKTQHIEAADPAAKTDWEEAARRFHRFGSSPENRLEPKLDSGFNWSRGGPAALLPLLETRPGMPAILMPGEDGGPPDIQPLDLVLERGLETVRGAGHPARVLGELLPRLVRRISRRTRDEKQLLAFREVAGEGTEALLSELALSGESGETLEEDCRSLLSTIPISWQLIGPSVASAHLAVETVRRAREPARSAIAREVRTLSEHVDNLLIIDEAKGTSSSLSDGLRDGLGRYGLTLIDHEALAKMHPDRKARRLEKARRGRLEKASKVLGEWLEQSSAEPLGVYLVSSKKGLSISEKPLPAGVFTRQAERPLKTAIEVFLEAAAPIVELARAIRVARLEMSGSYRPEIHDDTIETLNWQALKRDELALVPPVIATMDCSTSLEQSIGELCQLVWSGRPVLVLSSGPVPDPSELEDLSRHQPSLGTLMVAMHHAWVLQGSTAQPEHLARSLLGSDPCRPSIAFIAEAETPILGEAAVAGRARPLFVFRPGSAGGELDLTGNPSVVSDWPTYTLEIKKEKKTERIELRITFAEAAAAWSIGRDHLFAVPEEGFSTDQVPLDEWIAHPKRDLPGGPLPYIWIISDDGVLFRAIVSRALALACADRLADFRLLQEMAGVGGVHLARAREDARAEALAEAKADMERLTAEHEKALEEAVEETTRSAMAGLAAALLQDGAAGRIVPAGKPLPTAAPDPETERVESEPAEEAPAEPEEDEEEELLLQDPWINTPLCTSCNDCFKINELLFKYDENKQALFTDLSKGTYADLVRAAEICPAKCIHPGKPRPDDPTATPEMIERGSKL